MISRYTLMVFEHDAEMDPDKTGEWVKYEDYQALQAALREALDGWQKRCQLVEDGITDNVPMIEENNHIAELRKLFLEDI